jgi:hypothetical protein
MKIPSKYDSDNYMKIKFILALILCLQTTFSSAASRVVAKVGSGIGSVSPGTADIPTGGTYNFKISSANNVITYVTLDNMIVTLFRVGSIGSSFAILEIPENGKPRKLMVYFASGGVTSEKYHGSE